MADNTNHLTNKLWSYCHVLRDDGLSYQDYLEQLTFLLFLKMADERSELTGEPTPIPEGYRWSDLSAPAMTGEKLEAHYRKTLEDLAKESQNPIVLRTGCCSCRLSFCFQSRRKFDK